MCVCVCMHIYEKETSSETERYRWIKRHSFVLFKITSGFELWKKVHIVGVSQDLKRTIRRYIYMYLYQFSSVTQSCLTLCNLMDCSMPGLPVHHPLPELAQTHVHWVSDVIQSSHPLLPLSPPAFNLPLHQGLFQWVSTSYQVAEVWLSLCG